MRHTHLLGSKTHPRPAARHMSRSRRALAEALERRAMLSAGDLDTSFGGGDGIARSDFGGNDTASAMVVQPDANVVVAGSRWGSDAGYAGAVLARYTPTGPLDRTFGRGGPEGDGVVATGLIGSARSVALGPDGKIILAGRAMVGVQLGVAVMRFNPDGTPDVTFGRGGADGDGVVTTDISGNGNWANGVAVRPDGKVLVAATAGADFTLVQYNADGTPDTGFGPRGDGVTTADFGFSGGDQDYAESLAVLPDGKVLVAGTAYTGGAIGVARFDPDGTLDPTFGGGDGLATAPVSEGVGGCSLSVSPAGKVYVAATAGNRAPTPAYGYVALAAFQPDGSTDWLTTTRLRTRSEPHATALDADGRVLVAGTSADDHGAADFALARFLSDGRLDSAFGGGSGFVLTDFGRADDVARALAVLPTGRILVAGTSGNNFFAGTDFALARYVGDVPRPAPLVVNGTGGNDRVLVSAAADRASLRIEVNGVVSSRTIDGVSEIVVNGLGGNDRLQVATSVGLHATLDGGPGNDTLLGGAGNDTLLGGDGNDRLDGRGGSDLFRGGVGTDTADYTSRKNGVFVGIGTSADDGEKGEGDTVSSDVENVWGGRGNDTLRGSSANNRLVGGAGEDVLVGRAGNDTLLGGDGNDTLTDAEGSNTLDGGPGTDTVNGVREASGPVTYQAEQAILTGAVTSSAHAGFTGTGFVDFVNLSDDVAEFTVRAPAAGWYDLSFRYANGASSDRPMGLSVNGAAVAGGVAFPRTGSWTAWRTATVPAELRAGANAIRLAATGLSGPNVDALTIAPRPAAALSYLSQVRQIDVYMDERYDEDIWESAHDSASAPDFGDWARTVSVRVTTLPPGFESGSATVSQHSRLTDAGIYVDGDVHTRNESDLGANSFSSDVDVTFELSQPRTYALSYAVMTDSTANRRATITLSGVGGEVIFREATPPDASNTVTGGRTGTLTAGRYRYVFHHEANSDISTSGAYSAQLLFNG